MQLLPPAIAQNLPHFKDTESVPLAEKIAQVKLFHPTNQLEWYPLEFDREDTCWGVVVGNTVELSYFSLEELRKLSNMIGLVGLHIEREQFAPTKLKDLGVPGLERLFGGSKQIELAL